jgi:hypothetical protein
MLPSKLLKLLRRCFQEEEWTVLQAHEEFKSRIQQAQTVADMQALLDFGEEVLEKNYGWHPSVSRPSFL